MERKNLYKKSIDTANKVCYTNEVVFDMQLWRNWQTPWT